MLEPGQPGSGLEPGPGRAGPGRGGGGEEGGGGGFRKGGIIASLSLRRSKFNAILNVVRLPVSGSNLGPGPRGLPTV